MSEFLSELLPPLSSHEAVTEAIAAPFPPDSDVTKNVYINY